MEGKHIGRKEEWKKKRKRKEGKKSTGEEKDKTIEKGRKEVEEKHVGRKEDRVEKK